MRELSEAEQAQAEARLLKPYDPDVVVDHVLTTKGEFMEDFIKRLQQGKLTFVPGAPFRGLFSKNP